MLSIAFCQDLTCYSCGYREDSSGHRTKIPSEEEDIAFCGNDTIKDAPTELAPPVEKYFTINSNHYF